MRDHEYFVELCALAALGDITADQQQNLDVHAVECSDCRTQLRQLRDVVHNWLPLADSGLRHLPNIVLRRDLSRRTREEYLARARRDGLELTVASVRRGSFWSAAPWSSTRPYLRWAGYLTCVALIGITIALWPRNSTSPSLSMSPSSAPSDASIQIANLKSELVAVRKLNGEQTTIIAMLGRDRGEAIDQARSLDQLLETSRKQAQQLREELALARASSSEAEQHLTAELRKAEDLIAQLNALRDARTQDQASAVAAQVRIQELSEQVKLQSAGVERDRELLAANHDIRDLMTARNLHILDVHDFDLKGQARRSFGRVFYTEGKSLIFYAYDLPTQSPKNSAFQAWGQKTDGSRQAINLGLFYVDDQKQARWVLKFDNPDVLRQLDSVFVTVEPPGGTRQPSGHKLLYAWLGNDPNHP